MLQTNIREGYKITTLEVIELIEDLISYYSAKVKTENLSNMLTLILSKTAQRQSSSIVSNRSTALITNKFSVALLTKLAILNNANVTLVDAVHYSVVIDALIITLIKDNDDLLGTVNSYIKLRRLRARCKTKAADSRYAKVSRGRTKKDKDLEDSNTSSDVLRLRRRDRAAACARLAKRKQLGKKAQLKKTRDKEELAKAKKEKEEKELTDAYILYFKELLSNNSRIFANAIGIGKTQAIVLAVLIEHFYFFSNSPPENIGRLIKEEVIEMQINTTNAISKALAAANKLVALRSYIILEANTPAVHSKAIKHCLALLAVRFVIVCSFRKVDKYMFRAYNTISVTAQRTIIRKGSSYIEKRAILLPNSVTSDCIYKIEDVRNIIANIKHNASKHELSYNCLCPDFLSTVQNAEQQYRDILEKEGLNKLEASRRVIFNCFEMQAIASYPTLATLKAAYVKDLFTNLSKDYFLVREARAITKSSLNIAVEDAAKAANILLLLKKVCAKILIESYKPIVQARDLDRPWIIVALIAFAEAIILTEAMHVLAEMCVGIVYFNLDSELELKVLGKQDVKTTS
ncbi:hypothetical protein HBH50_249150 [Parastagonospora nodorum]|nr:hypothetical protein HBH50_249150 [Parastagonospora nodorum]KAH4077115.1 hypothetical protein HBH48_247650 [Parastagonospora nodorum]